MTEKSLKELGKEINNDCRRKGFYDPLDDNLNNINRLCCFLHSEVNEVWESIRKGLGKDATAEELADVAIVLLDLAHFLKVDLYGEIERKIKINRERPEKHGKVF